MPWDSIETLRKSELYKRMDSLKAMSTRQLKRFIEVFNAVEERASSGGAEKDHAEATAIAMALSSARRASASLDRVLSQEVHYFAAMAPHMFGGENGKVAGRTMDFSWITQNPDLASLTVAGNDFNFDHKQSDTALGQIRGIVLREKAPQPIRDATHKDIPFLFVASYYEDTDQELRSLDTISAEWITAGMSDGIETPIPLSFAVTREPLNDKTLGIKRIGQWTPSGEGEMRAFQASLAHQQAATAQPGSNIRAHDTFKRQREPMAPTVEELTVQIAALTQRQQTFTEGLASLRATVNDLPGCESLKETLAGLKPDADPKTVLAALGTHLKGLATANSTQTEAMAGLQKQINDMRNEKLAEKAAQFSASLVRLGKIKTSETEKWAGLFSKDEKMANELAAGLAEGVYLGENKGDHQHRQVEANASLDAMLENIDPRLAKTKKEAA